MIAARAFVGVLRTPLGFDPDRVVRVDVAPPRGTTDFAGFYRRVVEHLAARPDVVAAGATGTAPFSGVTGWSAVYRPGTKERIAAIVHSFPGYFEAIGVAPSSGRTLRWDDAGVSTVITEAAARVLFGAGEALGQTIDAGDAGKLRVVGVIPAPRQSTTESPEATAHVHVIPTGRTTLASVFAKVRSRHEGLLRLLRRDLGVVAPGAPVTTRWWADTIAATSAYRDPGFQALVLGAFAVVAIGLTALGVFGLVAALVASRAREMGVRLAIGAEPRGLVGLMVWQAFVPVAGGLVAGVLSAHWAARWAESRFVKLDTSDPWTLVIAGAAVTVATALAAFIPARRVTRIDPTVVLKTT